MPSATIIRQKKTRRQHMLAARLFRIWEGSILDESDGSNGRAISSYMLERQGAESEEAVSHKVQIREIFDDDKGIVRQHLLMKGKGRRRNGVQADGVEANPLFAALDEVFRDVVADAGIVPKIARVSPVSVPAGAEEEKFSHIGIGPAAFNAIHGDPAALPQIGAVDDQSSADKLRDGETVQRCAAREQVGLCDHYLRQRCQRAL